MVFVYLVAYCFLSVVNIFRVFCGFSPLPKRSCVHYTAFGYAHLLFTLATCIHSCPLGLIFEIVVFLKLITRHPSHVAPHFTACPRLSLCFTTLPHVSQLFSTYPPFFSSALPYPYTPPIVLNDSTPTVERSLSSPLLPRCPLVTWLPCRTLKARLTASLLDTRQQLPPNPATTSRWHLSDCCWKPSTHRSPRISR